MSEFQERTDKVPDCKRKSKFGRIYGREKNGFSKKKLKFCP
ncbi:MAG: hypothetical protein ACI4HN_04965 [Ruminococcus sp.]